MNSFLFTQKIDQINSRLSIEALEAGRVLFFPEYFFSSEEEPYVLSESILEGTHKNISYDYLLDKLGGHQKKDGNLEYFLRPFMRGYAEFAFQLIQLALPLYSPHLQWGRTSFRPAKISGRNLSKRKDDTRLHVDSFPATPVNGLRILRVFCNINPQQEPRTWNIGEPFANVLQVFNSQIPPYSKFKAKLLKMVKATKTLRSPYDHCMIYLHDLMKLNDNYQKSVQKTQVNFPAKSTWIVFTDQVSHAALSGQYVLEHTFYLPVEKMTDKESAPLYHWKNLKSELFINDI